MRTTIIATAAAALIAIAGAAAASTIAKGDMLGVDEGSVRATLVEKGFEVRKIDDEDGMIEVYALKDGKRFELYVNRATGAVAKVKEDE